MARRQYGSGIAFNDLLFNLVVGFVFLFVVAFILINPPTKRADIPTKAEYLFVIEWDPEFNDDIDLWVRDPNGTTVSFVRKEGGLLNLEKDDLGSSNDTYVGPDGEQSVIKINREVTTMRGIIPGTYTVFAHVYNIAVAGKFNEDTGMWEAAAGQLDYRPLNFTLIRVNPYQEIYRSIHRYREKGQEIPLLEFDLDINGVASNFRFPKEGIVTRGRIRAVTVEETYVSGGLQIPRPNTDVPVLRNSNSADTGHRP